MLKTHISHRYLYLDWSGDEAAQLRRAGGTWFWVAIRKQIRVLLSVTCTLHRLAHRHFLIKKKHTNLKKLWQEAGISCRKCFSSQRFFAVYLSPNNSSVLWPPGPKIKMEFMTRNIVDHRQGTRGQILTVYKQGVKQFITNWQTSIFADIYLTRLAHQIKSPGGWVGGGEFFRNFWVRMCRWDPGTLSLHQS